MLKKVYKNMKTNEIVTEAEALGYVLDKLGITLEGKGKFDTFSKDQVEFQSMLVDWYFSDNWYKDVIDTNDYEVNEWAERQDMKYQDKVDRDLGIL